MKTKSKKLRSLIICFLLLTAFLAGCNNNGDENEDEKKETTGADVIKNETLFDLDLTEREIAFVEDLTEKDFETLTPEDLKIYKTISVVGDHVLFGEYLANVGQGTYMIKYDQYEIGPDYSDCLYLLKYFPELKNISIYFHNTLTDASFLKDIPNLEKLTLYGTRIEDLSVLKNHPKFKFLDVKNSPVSKIEFHEDAVLDVIILDSTFFGDLSIIEGQSKMTQVSIRESFVPITNTQVLAKFKQIDILDLVAPACDYSFFEDMSVGIPNVTLGGYDNIDLSVLNKVIDDMWTFYLYFSKGTDLTILDKLHEGGGIFLFGCNPGDRGTRTTEGAEHLREYPDTTWSYPYYKKYLPEFLPEEFK